VDLTVNAWPGFLQYSIQLITSGLSDVRKPKAKIDTPIFCFMISIQQSYWRPIYDFAPNLICPCSTKHVSAQDARVFKIFVFELVEPHIGNTLYLKFFPCSVVG
jgi:hypothetical protein